MLLKISYQTGLTLAPATRINRLARQKPDYPETGSSRRGQSTNLSEQANWPPPSTRSDPIDALNSLCNQLDNSRAYRMVGELGFFEEWIPATIGEWTKDSISVRMNRCSIRQIRSSFKLIHLKNQNPQIILCIKFPKKNLIPKFKSKNWECYGKIGEEIGVGIEGGDEDGVRDTTPSLAATAGQNDVVLGRVGNFSIIIAG